MRSRAGLVLIYEREILFQSYGGSLRPLGDFSTLVSSLQFHGVEELMIIVTGDKKKNFQLLANDLKNTYVDIPIVISGLQGDILNYLSINKSVERFAFSSSALEGDSQLVDRVILDCGRKAALALLPIKYDKKSLIYQDLSGKDIRLTEEDISLFFHKYDEVIFQYLSQTGLQAGFDYGILRFIPQKFLSRSIFSGGIVQSDVKRLFSLGVAAVYGENSIMHGEGFYES